MPKVIVYTVAYNAEKTIKHAIDSILNQTHSDWIYYVVDNGATDATGKIIKDYAAKDSRIIPLRNEKNHVWKLENRSTSVLASHEENDFFCMLDADDEYKPDFMAHMLEFIESNNLDCAACGNDVINVALDKISGVRCLPNDLVFEGSGFSELFDIYYQYFVAAWGKMISISVYRQIEWKRIPRSVTHGRDTLLMLESLRVSNRVGILAESLHKYYVYPNSLAKRWSNNRIASNRILDDTLRSFLISKCSEVIPRNDAYLIIIYFMETEDTMHVLIKSDLSLNYKLTCLHDIFTNERTQRMFSISSDEFAQQLSLWPDFIEKRGRLLESFMPWLESQKEIVKEKADKALLIGIQEIVLQSIGRSDHELFSFYIDIKKTEPQIFDSLKLAVEIIALTAQYPLLAEISSDLATSIPQVVIEVMNDNLNTALEQFLELSETAEIMKKDVESYILLGQNLAAAAEHTGAYIYFKKVWISHLIDSSKNVEALRELDEFDVLLPGDEDLISLRERLGLLGQVDTYFIVENIHHINNGIVISVLRKATLFQEKWGYRPTIVVAEYNQNLKDNIHYLVHDSASKISADIKIQNVYDYFRKTEDPNLPIIDHPRSREGLKYREIGPNTFEVSRNGALIRWEYFDHPDNRLESVIHLDIKGKTTQVDFYDKKGYLIKTREMDSVYETRYHTESYYTAEGKMCIKSEYAFKNDEHVLTGITLYDDFGNVLGEGADEGDLLGFYMDQIAATSNRICLFVNETGIYDNAVTRVKQKNAIKIALVHSAFLEDSYNLRSEPQLYYKHLVRYSSHFDGIVFLTKAEGNDFVQYCGKSQRIFTIPHFYHKEIKEVDFDMRDSRKAVIIARFDYVKRLDTAVEVFKLVLDKLPDVKLEFYGYGSKKEVKEVRKLIKKYRLDKSIRIVGVTEQPEEVFKGAALSMMTSSVEGFGITLIESISNGCPAFSFDIKYGPAEIIKHGKTGYLIPRGDIKAYAKQIISYFENLDLQRQMSENAYKDAHRFSKEVFLENWYGFMEAVVGEAVVGEAVVGEEH